MKQISPGNNARSIDDFLRKKRQLVIKRIYKTYKGTRQNEQKQAVKCEDTGKIDKHPIKGVLKQTER